MVTTFLDDNNREFLQRRRRTAKKQMVEIGKKTSLHAHHGFFVQFLAVVARLRHEISRARFMELVSTTQKFRFSFSKLTYSLFGFNPENFAII